MLPPASGKSVIAFTLAEAFKSTNLSRPVILCTDKELQAQYQNDFGSELSIVTGAAEYECSEHHDDNVSRSCATSGFSCVARKAGLCPYITSRQTIADAPHALCFNVHSYLASRKRKLFQESVFPKGDGLLIIDEAHKLPSILTDILTVKIPLSAFTDDLKAFIAEYFPKNLDKNPQGLPVCIAKPNNKDKLRELANFLLECSNEGEQEEALAFRRLADSLNHTVDMLHESLWLMEVVKDRESSELVLQLTPTVIPFSFLESFFAGFSKVIFMSGSLFRLHLELLGLAPTCHPAILAVKGDGLRLPGESDERLADRLEIEFAQEVTYFDSGSPIHKRRRRIFIDFANGREVKFSNIKESFEWFGAIVADVASCFPGHNGMIHVSSGVQVQIAAEACARNAAELAENQGEEAPLFYPISGGGWKVGYKSWLNRRHAELARRKDNPSSPEKPGEFLIAARRYEGIDLKDDLARLLFVFKAPFSDTENVYVQAMQQLFTGFLEVTTLAAFIQEVNRTTRHPGDYSLIICLDIAIARILQAYGDSLPRYIAEAIVEVEPDDPAYYRRIQFPME